MATKHTCPECHLILDAELPDSGLLVCPLCNKAFSPFPPAGAPAIATPPPITTSGRYVLRGVVGVAAVGILAGGLGYAYHLVNGLDHRVASVPPPAKSDSPKIEPPQTVEIIPINPAQQQLQELVQKQRESFAQVLRQLNPNVTVQPPSPESFQKRPLFPPIIRQAIPAPEEERQPLTLPERVNRAIERGLAFLRAHHSEVNQYHNYLGLLGLTFLECGIAADDASIRQIAALIRARERELMQTYELTLAILFLDRLGDPRDRARIRTFGERLLSGQFDCGAWSYSSFVNGRQAVRTRFWDPGLRRITYRGDNSNTQFAILGLWVAQRYGVLARPALLDAERYFRTTQADDGSWAYQAKARNNRDSMTCAGLMSLAMRYGVSAAQGRDIRPDHPISVQDPAIHRGLRYLAQTLDKIIVRGKRIVGVEARDPLYFLWSLERMAVIYDLKKIGEREWYPWAAQMLVDTQGPDGRLQGLGDPVGTCFALLVLKRSNFAKDLQLAVQEPSSRPLPDVSSPTIRQGLDAFLERSPKPPAAAPMPGMTKPSNSLPPLGPPITRPSDTKR